MDRVVKQAIAVVVTVVLFAGALVGFAWWKFNSRADSIEGRLDRQNVEFRATIGEARGLLTQAEGLVASAAGALATDPVGLRQLVAEIVAFSESVPATVAAAVKAGTAELQRATKDTLAQLKETADAIALTLRNANPQASVDVKVTAGGALKHNVHILQPLVDDLLGLLNGLVGQLRVVAP